MNPKGSLPIPFTKKNRKTPSKKMTRFHLLPSHILKTQLNKPMNKESSQQDPSPTTPPHKNQAIPTHNTHTNLNHNLVLPSLS